MPEFFTFDVLAAFLQVVLIDLVLAGDNAVVIGLAAAGLPEGQRGKAILIGIGAATLLRILFAVATTQLMQIVGLLLAGGILLLWVCWKMWREVRASAKAEQGAQTPASRQRHAAENTSSGRNADHRRRRFDVARQRPGRRRCRARAACHPDFWPVALDRNDGRSGVLHRPPAATHRWIAYVGLLVILYVAIDMTVRGFAEVAKVAPT